MHGQEGVAAATHHASTLPRVSVVQAAAKARGAGGAPRPESDCHAALISALNAHPQLKGLHFTCRPTASALTMVVRAQISSLTDGNVEYLSAPAVRDPLSRRWKCEKLLEGLRALRDSPDALDDHPDWQLAIGETIKKPEYTPMGGLPPSPGSGQRGVGAHAAGAPEQYQLVPAAKKRISSKPAATRGAKKEQLQREGKGRGREHEKNHLDGKWLNE